MQKIPSMAVVSKEDKVINIIKKRIDEAEYGTLFFNNSFAGFDDEYVGQILSRLTKEGVIHRLCRDVYLKAENTRFGLVYPSIESIAKAIAERDNAQILPTGATALNMLGLSTQVPMNPTFLTSGSARMVKLGNRTITFKRAVPRNFAFKGEKRKLIVQALKAIGENGMTDEDYRNVQTLILRFPETESLQEDLPAMPTWIRRIFVKTLINNHYNVVAKS